MRSRVITLNQVIILNRLTFILNLHMHTLNLVTILSLRMLILNQAIIPNQHIIINLHTHPRRRRQQAASD